MNFSNQSTDVTKPNFSHRDRAAGFSLIELMISITLGLLIMAAVLALYLDLSRSNSELAKMNRQIENGRFTIQLLQQEIWHAGYWDTYVPPLPSVTPPTAIPNPCTNFTAWSAADIANMYAIPVQGYVAGTAPPGDCNVTSPQANSDVLVIRHAATCIAGDANCENFDAGKLYIQTQSCADTGHGNYYDDGDPNSDFPILGTPGINVYKKNCTTLADKRKLITSVFYVRNYSATAGDGIPTLMRANSESGAMQAAQPVIEGIQSLKLEYGQDTDEDGSPDIFNDCAACTETDWANVVAVRIHVLARNLEASSGYVEDKSYVLGATTLGPFNDGFMRHAYSSYVRLVNPSGRREKP